MIAGSGRSERVYRVILAVYPAAFRRRFEDEMILLFHDKLRDARAAGSVFGIASTWLRMVSDVVLTAPAIMRPRTS